MVAWLAPDLLTKALFAEIDAVADDNRAMTAVARAERLAELDAQLLAAEQEEEALVRLALDEGMQADRRAKADPRAVLQIAVI
jgi:hypothetical protein